jgi:uncharacterized protein DUF6010
VFFTQCHALGITIGSGTVESGQQDGYSVTTKSVGRCWIEQPVHWWACRGCIVCSRRFARRDRKHRCVSTGLPRTMGTDILGVFPCRDCRLYLSFAAYFGASTHAWQTELIGVAVFLVCAVGGLFSRSAIALGYVMHGLWDLSHCLSGSSLAGLSITEIPLGYGIFCSTFDFVVACYLMITDSAWHEPGKLDLYSWRHRL